MHRGYIADEWVCLLSAYGYSRLMYELPHKNIGKNAVNFNDNYEINS